MVFKDIEIKELSGEQLLSENHNIDAWKQPIKIGTKYKVKLYHKQKRMTILSEKDWKIKEFYELGQTIFNQGGLFKWVDYGMRLGFIKEYSDYIETVEEMIEVFNERGDYEKSIYFRNELKKFKRRIKNESNNQK